MARPLFGNKIYVRCRVFVDLYPSVHTDRVTHRDLVTFIYMICFGQLVIAALLIKTVSLVIHFVICFLHESLKSMCFFLIRLE